MLRDCEMIQGYLKCLPLSHVQTLCDPMDCSPPGSSVHEILQARILEWVVISFSRGIFPTQGSNPGLLHCRGILCHLSHRLLREKIEGFKTEEGRWGGGDVGWRGGGVEGRQRLERYRLEPRGAAITGRQQRQEDALPEPPGECSRTDTSVVDSTLQS